jgi:membrane protease YdiL (CAAX protease family)
MMLAFLSPLAVLTIAAAIHMALWGSLRPSPALSHGALFVVNFGLVFLAGGPLGEEFGWRGYALPAMQERLGWRSASVVLGTIWGVWHLPLFFVAGSSQNQGSMAAFFVLIVATSVFYTWLFNRTNGSVLPALALHTASNSWPSFVPILPSDADLRPYLLVIGLVVTAAIWLLFRRERNQTKPGLAS